MIIVLFKYYLYNCKFNVIIYLVIRLKKILLLISCSFLILLSSCSIIFVEQSSFYQEEETEFSTENLNPDTYDNYKNCEVSFKSLNYKSVYNSFSSDVLPQTGNLNILVLPVEISDYPFDDDYKTVLEKGLNGDGINDTNYWESLKSFYFKSSYGKVNINCVIADKYESNYSAIGLSQLSKIKTNSSIKMLDKAYNNYIENNGVSSLLQFDSESDGLIDAVITIYSAPTIEEDNYIKSIDKNGDLFWAFQNTASTYSQKDVNKPIYCNYMWLSIDFFYNNRDKNMIDAHTVIHEFGHCFGLDDYYSYDDFRSPAGGFDMMDSNIGDHCAFTKLSLGWINPIFAYGKSKITLHDFESTGECILVSDNWNYTAFDEFLLIELYTPTNLNELDSTTAYPNCELLYTEPGIKIWHVDNRLIRYNQNKEYSYVVNEPSELDLNYSYIVGHSNSKKDIANGNYDLLRLIECNTDRLDSDSILKYDGFASNDSLWKDSYFTIENKKNLFPNGTRFDNGNKFNYKISIDKFEGTSAEITIETL